MDPQQAGAEFAPPRVVVDLFAASVGPSKMFDLL